jgi:LuxR family transcriptional regulator, maltose regulon positive regulatory protein
MLQGTVMSGKLTRPWLGHCAGGSAPGDSPVAARTSLAATWAKFEERGDRMGQLLTAAAMVETYQLEWSCFAPLHPWIDRLLACLDPEPAFPSREAELQVYANLLFAISRVRPAPALAPLCIARLRALLDADLEFDDRLFAGRSLLIAATLDPDLVWPQDVTRRLQVMLQEERGSPAARVSALNAIAHGLWLDCAYPESEAALREAANIAKRLNLGSADPLHYQVRHLVAFARRDLNEMADCVHAMRRLINPTWHSGMAMLSHALAEQATLRADRSMALSHWTSAISRIDQAGALPMQFWLRLALSGARAGHGDYVGAAEVLGQARALFGDALPVEMRCNAELVGAYLALCRGEHREVHGVLTAALSGASLPGPALQIVALLPNAMGELCMEAVRAGVAVEPVNALVERYRLPPPETASRDWPWPFRVSVLGAFRLLKGGAPIRCSRRTQKKTLELLQALIAFGGTEVAAGKLIDALWPDSDGDAGYHALESALYRLRLLLGAPGAVIMAGGKLSLARQYFWVDMWDFEKQLRASVDHGDDSAARFARIRELYKGHFLQQEADKPWTVMTRQALRGKFLRALRDAAQDFEHRGRWQEAADVYQAGIELDGMAEDLYRGLMICHRELGDHIEALQVYRRCRELLGKVLGVQPNPKTLEIYQSVRDLHAEIA